MLPLSPIIITTFYGKVAGKGGERGTVGGAVRNVPLKLLKARRKTMHMLIFYHFGFICNIVYSFFFIDFKFKLIKFIFQTASILQIFLRAP